jgi:NADPH-ferrihemoprotein reductase
LGEEKLLVFTVATYGEGEPPDNAQEFHRWLMDDERPSDLLSNTRFAVFGLGNKTYEHYNQMGKEVDRRLKQLGGTRLVQRGEGNDDAK